MRMFRTGINKEFLVHRTAQTVLREHALYRSFDHHFRTAFQQVLGSFAFLTTRVTGISQVFLVVELVTSENNLFGVDHDDIVTTVSMRSIVRFVLTSQNCRDPGAHSAYSLVGSIDN